MKRLSEIPGGDGRVRAIWNRLDRLYDDLEHNVLKVWCRRDVVFAMDLAWHSALLFCYRGQIVPRGWVEIMIPGDAGTAKSTIAERSLGHYRAGELRSGEGMSVAGMVGGVDKIGDRNVAKWGFLARCDGRLLVIDEAHAMREDVMDALTSVRSTGYAEITKIVHMRTRARVRKIFIANPPSGRPSILSYGVGILVVPDLVRQTEDVRRFDLVCVAAQEDVARGEIDEAAERPAPPHRHTSALCNRLVRWIWSRRPDQIEIRPAVETVARVVGRELADRYSPEIKLFLESECGVKLLRLAVALAGRLFSTDDAMEKIVVEPEHVRAAAAFVRWCYDKPTCAFDLYSRSRMPSAQVEQRMRQYGRKILRAFQYTQTVTRVFCEDVLGDRGEAADLFRFLLTNGAIARTGKAALKTGDFAALLSRLIVEEGIPEERTGAIRSPENGGD